MAKTLALTAIVLLTAACTESGEYRDGGSVLNVGDDISPERAATLVATGFAMPHDAAGAAEVVAAGDVPASAKAVIQGEG